MESTNLAQTDTAAATEAIVRAAIALCGGGTCSRMESASWPHWEAGLIVTGALKERFRQKVNITVHYQPNIVFWGNWSMEIHSSRPQKYNSEH